MTITRVQQVSAVLAGTSDTVTLPAAPTYGNTLIAVLARAGAAPVATSLTQTNVTWSSVVSGSNAREVGHQIFVAQNVGPAAGDTITVTRADADEYAVVVFEYAGLLKTGTVTDQTATASQDGQSPYTGAAPLTTQPDELFLAAIAHTLPERLLDDNLNADQGYWRADSTVTSSIVFGGDTATVAGAMYVEPTGSSAWSDYRVAVDAAHTSPAVGGGGWFGLALYTSGDYLAATANGYAGLINTLDNTVYALKALNGVLTVNAYPYSGTLVAGQTYRLELRARTTQAGSVLLEFYVDGALEYTETHTSGATAGAPGLAVSAATAQTATFNNLLVTGLSDELVRQYGPSNQFVEVAQSDATDVAFSRASLAVFEKIADATEVPDLTVQTDRSVVWNSRLQTFLADLSSTATATADLSSYVADLFQAVQSLDVAVAEARSDTITMDMRIRPILMAEIQVLVGGTAVLADVDVLLDPTTDRRVLLDVRTGGTILLTASLQPAVSLGTFTQTANLNAHVGTTAGGPSKNPERRYARLDVAVLRTYPDAAAITTPEGSAYLACRPLWCNVPRRHLLSAAADVAVAGGGTVRTGLQVSVRYENWYQRRGLIGITMNVLLDS